MRRHLGLDANLHKLEWQPLKSKSPFVSMNMRFDAESSESANKSVAIGKAECQVDASAAEVSAWFWHYNSYERMQRHIAEGHPARLSLSESAAGNDQVLCTIKRMPLLFHDREFVFRRFVVRKFVQNLFRAASGLGVSLPGMRR